MLSFKSLDPAMPEFPDLLVRLIPFCFSWFEFCFSAVVFLSIYKITLNHHYHYYLYYIYIWHSIPSIDWPQFSLLVLSVTIYPGVTNNVNNFNHRKTFLNQEFSISKVQLKKTYFQILIVNWSFLLSIIRKYKKLGIRNGFF